MSQKPPLYARLQICGRFNTIAKLDKHKVDVPCVVLAGEFSSPSRPESREAPATDDDLTDSRRRTDPHRRTRRTAEPFYDGMLLAL